MAEINLIDIWEEFLDLTSNKAIREAAYPEEEWVENGGNIANGLLGGLVNNYNPVSLYDEPPTITKYINLLTNTPNPTISQNNEKRAANIASHWLKVQSHQYYEILNKDSNFKKAFATFQTKKKLVSAPAELKSEFADFRFYNLTALHIGLQKIYDELGYIKSYPDRKLLNKAKGHIKKLQSFLGNGLKLNNFQSHQQLQNHLCQLIIEIDQAPRKDNETKTAPKRRSLEGFALSSFYAFGEASATILGYLALMLEWDNYSHKTMETIVSNVKNKAKKERLNALANALKPPVQKS
jgi:hypothetical protein